MSNNLQPKEMSVAPDGDLISRRALGIGLCNPDAFPEENQGFVSGWNSAVALINGAPAVDAVEVVRCAECKHLNVINRPELYAYCPKTNTPFRPFKIDTRTHFCSLGKRRDGK